MTAETSPADPEHVAAALTGTALADRPIRTLPAIEGAPAALSIPVAPEEAHAAWDAARALVPLTARWPVLMDEMIEPDLFTNRWWFRYEVDGPPVPRHLRPPPRVRSVDDVLAEADDLDGDQAIAAFREEDDWRQPIEFELEQTTGLVGSAPTPEAVEAALGPESTRLGVERLLMAWEVEHLERPIEPSYHLPSETGAQHLVLLPTAVAWQAFAHLGFFTAEAERSGPFVAVMRMWFEQYGAELRCFFFGGTWMELVVARPPRDAEDAFGLASQIDQVAFSSEEQIGNPRLRGVRGLAHNLIQNPTWVLSARP